MADSGDERREQRARRDGRWHQAAGRRTVAELTVKETNPSQVKDLIYFGFGRGTTNTAYEDEPTNSILSVLPGSPTG